MRKIILLVLFLVALVAAVFMYQEQITKLVMRIADRGKEEVKEVVINAIAFLNDMNGNVAYKRSRETIWNMGQRQLGFEVLDTLSTGPSSNAELGFKIGPVFNLDENSLIVIQEPRENIAGLTEVDFEQGAFKASNDLTEDAVLRVRTDNMLAETVGVFDYDMAVDKKARTAKISVAVGSVKVTDKFGNEDWVMVNQTKEFSTEDISKSLVKEEIKEEPIPVVEEPKPVVKPVVKKRPKRVKKPVVKPVVKEEPVVIEDSNREKIWKSISKERIKIDECVQGVEIEKGSVVNLMVEVQNDGTVTDVEIMKSTVKNQSVVDCIISSIKSTRFDKFDSEQAIREAVFFVFNQDVNSK